jgi:hypothetical protein
MINVVAPVEIMLAKRTGHPDRLFRFSQMHEVGGNRVVHVVPGVGYWTLNPGSPFGECGHMLARWTAHTDTTDLERMFGS